MGRSWRRSEELEEVPCCAWTCSGGSGAGSYSPRQWKKPFRDQRSCRSRRRRGHSCLWDLGRCCPAPLLCRPRRRRWKVLCLSATRRHSERWPKQEAALPTDNLRAPADGPPLCSCFHCSSCGRRACPRDFSGQRDIRKHAPSEGLKPAFAFACCAAEREEAQARLISALPSHSPSSALAGASL